MIINDDGFDFQLGVQEILIRGLTWIKLLDPDKKGQWWLSGAGDMCSTKDNVEEVASSIDKEFLEAQKMLQLAAAQRMNTDARKAIFCIIMSGEDYIDAFEKLLRLDLSGKQVCLLNWFFIFIYLFIIPSIILQWLYVDLFAGQRDHSSPSGMLFAGESVQ